MTENSIFPIPSSYSASEYKFKKTAVMLGEKSEKFIEILPDNNVTTKTKLLTKGVFELTN